MLDSARITAFAATANAARARMFYAETLELQFVYEDDFAIVFNSGDIELRIQKLEKFTLLPSGDISSC